MPSILDYAGRRKKSWNDYAHALWDASGGIFILLILTIAAGLIALTLRYDWHSIERYKDEHYWTVLFNGWGYEVDWDATSIIYVWNGRDSHIYFRIDQKAAAACADKSAQEYAQTLIRYALDAHDTGGDTSRFLNDLHTLTGQDFKADLPAWQKWAGAHLRDLKGGDALYQRLLEARSLAVRSDPIANGSLTNFRDPLIRQASARQTYQQEVKGFWFNPWHLLKAGLLAAYLVTLLILWRRHARKRRIEAAIL